MVLNVTSLASARCCWARRGTACRRSVAAKLFTGIVQGTATVENVDSSGDLSRLRVSFPGCVLDGVTIGASVALNGTCLTVTAMESDELTFDVIAETLRRTNLGRLCDGSLVNFERSAQLGDEIGGHCVSGHVHTTAELSVLEKSGDNVRLQLKLVDASWVKYIFPKGFVAVDGCSLTVGEVGEDWFSVYLIPETLQVTALSSIGEGDHVNIEVDSQTQAVVDTVERVLPEYLLRMRVAVS